MIRWPGLPEPVRQRWRETHQARAQFAVRPALRSADPARRTGELTTAQFHLPTRRIARRADMQIIEAPAEDI